MIWYLPNLLFILLISWRLRPQESLRKTYWTTLFLKMLAGIALGYLYFTKTGGGDTVYFHQQATELYTLFRGSFSEYLSYLFTSHHPMYMSEARNELFIKIISIFYLISGGDYWLSSLYLSTINFLGAWYFVRSVHLISPKLFIPASLGFLFLPSAVFWSSGVLKDPLVNAAVFFLAGISLRYYKNLAFRWWEFLCSILALLLLYYLKYYLLAVAVLVLAALVWNKVLVLLSKRWHKNMLSILVATGIIFIASRLHWNLNFSHLPEVIHTNYTIIFQNSEKNNTLNFSNLQPTWSSLLAHLPRSFFAGIYRPFPGEGSIFNFIHGLENVFLVLLSLANFYCFRSIRLNLPVCLAILHIIILASFLPLASPNFGSLIRYKAAYLPFLFFLLAAIPYQKYWESRKPVEPGN